MRMKFWSKDDPSIQIAEFVHCLAIMGCPNKPSKSILDKVTISVSGDVAEVIATIKIALKENIGGSEKHQLDQFADEVGKCCTLSEIHNEKQIKITFSIDSQGVFKRPPAKP